MPEDASHGNYNVVISQLNPEADPQAAAEHLAQAIGVEPQVAQVILRKAPIALFKSVGREEVDYVRPFLVALAMYGIDFRITQKPAENIPKVNWPVKPNVRVIFREMPPPPEESPVGAPDGRLLRVHGGADLLDAEARRRPGGRGSCPADGNRERLHEGGLGHREEDHREDPAPARRGDRL